MTRTCQGGLAAVRRTFVASVLAVIVSCPSALFADEPADPFAPNPPRRTAADPFAASPSTPAASRPSVPAPQATRATPPPSAVPRVSTPAASGASAPAAGASADPAGLREAQRLEDQARQRELEAGMLRERARDLRDPAAAPFTSRRRTSSSGYSFRYAGREFQSYDEFRASPEWRMMRFDLKKRQQRAAERRTAAQEARRAAVQFEREWRKLSPVARYFSGL